MSGIITRRSLLRGLFATPAIVAASSLMPLRGIAMQSVTNEGVHPWMLVDFNEGIRRLKIDFPYPLPPQERVYSVAMLRFLRSQGAKVVGIA